jgi:Tfp pilus assembly protein PilP
MPITTSAQKLPDDDTPPLERYPLSDLRLTAIVADARGDVFASVENPDGVGFKVDVGTKLGTSRAHVVQITRRGLILEERTVTASGTEETTTRELLLRKR